MNELTFHVTYTQYLNDQSELTQQLPTFATEQWLIDCYKQLSLVRVFDTQMVNLHRTGRIGTFPSSQGQEAVFTAIGLAMQGDDIHCPFYRDQGVFIQRGYAMEDILAYWAGDERGNASTAAKSDFPICVPIASQCLHATGVAFAIKHRNEKRVVVTDIGEGGTSKGDFYEAMNLAGTWNLPMVFVINNNQWAISVPASKQTAAQSFAQKGIAAGLDVLRVDGNDIVAVYEAVQKAIAQARNGGKPTVIEAITFRLCDHTTVDDASRYVDPEHKKAALEKEPIERLRQYLISQNLWSDDLETQLQKQYKAQVETAIDNYFTRTKQAPTDMFDYLFDTLPDAYLDQRDDLLEQLR